MATKEIQVKFKTAATIKWVYIDDKKLSLIDGVSEKITVNIGETYSFSWFLRGAPKTAYDIEIIGTDFKTEGKRIPKDKTKAKGAVWLKISE